MIEVETILAARLPDSSKSRSVTERSHPTSVFLDGQTCKCSVTHAGTDAIRAWKIDTSTRYRITAEPIESRNDGDRTVVVVKVSGTFPGSPANLTYRFGFAADGRIGALEVR